MWFIYADIDVEIPGHEPIFEQRMIIENFTYWDCVYGLYTGTEKGPRGPTDAIVIPVSTLGAKLSAILLVFLSGVWPHAKLMLLQVVFFYPRFKSPQVREKMSYILETFGKWSLADVLLVSVLFAVLNLDMELSAMGVIEGDIRLRVASYSGITIFSTGVLISCGLSLYVSHLCAVERETRGAVSLEDSLMDGEDIMYNSEDEEESMETLRHTEPYKFWSAMVCVGCVYKLIIICVYMLIICIILNFSAYIH